MGSINPTPGRITPMTCCIIPITGNIVLLLMVAVIVPMTGSRVLLQWVAEFQCWVTELVQVTRQGVWSTLLHGIG